MTKRKTPPTIDAAALPGLVRSAWSEREFQRQVKALAEQCGWLVYHDYDSRRSAAGFPDLCLAHERRGVALFCELKVKGRKPTPQQARWLVALKSAGITAVCWRPSDWDVIAAVLAAGRGVP